jgi:hypothetical protein
VISSISFQLANTDIRCCLEYHRVNSKKNTFRSYEAIISKFCKDYGQRPFNEITTDEVLAFLNHLTAGRKPQTKKPATHLFHHFSTSLNPT